MKNDSRFVELKSLYDALSSAEKEVLRTQLAAAQDTGYKAFQSMAVFLKALVDNPDQSLENFLSSNAIGSQSEQELNAIIHLSKEFILEQFSLYMNTERAGVYSNQFRTRIACAKKLEQAQILMGRGMLEEAKSLLNEVVSKAGKYELHHSSTEALRLLQLSASLEENPRKFRKTEIELNNVAARLHMRAISESIHLELKLYRNSAGHNANVEQLQKKCEELHKLNKVHELSYPEYICQLVNLESLCASLSYRKAENASKKLIAFIQNSPAISSNDRVIHAALTLIEIQLRQQKFAPAMETIDSFQAIAKKGSVENLAMIEYKILGYIYLGQYDQAAEYLQKLSKSKFTQSNEGHKSRLNYYTMINDFKLGKYKSLASNLLAELRASEDSNASLHFNKCALLAMAAPALKETDQTIRNKSRDMAADELEKYNQDKRALNIREKIILKLLLRLTKSEYDFVSTAQLSSANLEKLNEKQGPTTWEATSFELIPIHEWFKSKLPSKRGRPRKIASKKNK
jgi:hypothetical protein